MKFVVLNEKEFSTYALKSPYSNFHQTSMWGKLKNKNGWINHFIGVKDGNQILCASLILEKKLFASFSLFYAPRGFLIDYKNTELLSFFTDELKKYAKNNKAIFIKIDPYVIHKERDMNGKIIEDGIDNSEAITNLSSLGYKHTGFNLKQENMQPRWAFAINLENKSEDDILNNMDSKTRQLIRKNARSNITVREIKNDELWIFKDIMQHTSERRNFIDRPFEYYENMLNELGDMAKIYIAEINLRSLINKNKDQIKEYENIIKEKDQDIKANKANVSISKANKKIAECKAEIDKLISKNNHYETLIQNDKETITLGGIIYMIYNKEILSLFGGSYDKYMEFLSFYTIHWEMIKYAIHNDFKKYNFYGITGNFKDTKDELYGIYEFKKGFGGNVEEYLGEFDLITNKAMYFLYKYAYSLYKKLRK